jgi:hypothetical protein
MWHDKEGALPSFQLALRAPRFFFRAGWLAELWPKVKKSFFGKKRQKKAKKEKKAKIMFLAHDGTRTRNLSLRRATPCH